MANKSKQFKKFAASGKLKETIDKRRKNQQVRRKADDRQLRRTKQRGAPKEFGSGDEGEGEDADEDDSKERKGTNAAAGGRAGGVAKNVEELFGQGGLEGVDNGEGSDLEDLDSEDEDTEDDQEGDEEEVGEGEDEDLELSEEAMKKAMKDLEKKDPEFFKYLKENDGDLLEFGKGKSKAKAQDEDVDMDGEADDDEDEDEEEDEGVDEEQEAKKISVTGKMVKQWQEGMIKVRPSPPLFISTSPHTFASQHATHSIEIYLFTTPIPNLHRAHG